METSKLSMGTLIALVVGIVVGFLIGWGVYGRGSDNQSNRSDRTATSTWDLDTDTDSDFDLTGQDEAPAKSGSLIPGKVNGVTADFEVNDQAAGGAVNVVNVKADASTWVAVRDYRGGQLGNILGARRIEQSQAGVSVPLLRPTVAGNTYAVVLYRDNGDKLFNQKTDTLVTVAGAAAVGTFAAR